MERSQVVELHFITPFQNLPSITHHGILCHERAARLSHASIAMEAVQERRSKVRVPGGLRLHEYANLYFNARNTMMYVLTHKHLSIGVVSVHPAVLDGKGVVIADRNASADAVEFGTPEEMLPKLDYDTIFAERWDGYDDFWEKKRHKQAMCAEVLVPYVVPPENICRVWVSCDEAKSACDELHTGFKSEVNPYLFFRGSK